MKNSTAPNRKTGRMIAKNLIVLFTVALAGFCGIQAWFTDKSSAEADGINVECQAPDGIKIAVVKHNDPAPKDTEYTVGNIKLNKTNCKFLENLQLTEITSDGTDFYKPALIQTGGQAQVDTKADWSPAAANQHYLSFDLYIRSKSQYNIAIGKKSTIKPDAPQLTSQDGTGIKNKSKYGNFSRDSVVGAVRFSVVDYKSAPPLKKLLWLPAPNILTRSLELISPRSAKTFGSITLPASNRSNALTDTVRNTFTPSWRLREVKPNFGKRRYNGI